jgi:hypothetical protein
MTLLSSTLYPFFGVMNLRSQRGDSWARLVDHISTLNATDPQVMALSLTSRRLRRGTNLEHNTCHDPFCAVCAAQVVANFDGTESELIALYYRNLDEIRMRMATMRTRELVPAQITAVA